MYSIIGGIKMNLQELNKLTHKKVSERVNEGTKLFNNLVFFPIILAELEKHFSYEYCENFRQVVYDTCVLHPNWKEIAILNEVADLYKKTK